MDHYELDDWVDLVRGDIVKERGKEMSRHLDGGCDRCQELHGLAQELTEMADASQERSPRFPEHVLWAARVIFSAPGAGRPAALPRLRIELVKEAPLAAPVGVRFGGDRDVWQGLFHAGDIAVDLRMDYDRDRCGVALVGQVADRRDPGRGLADLPVCLLVREEIVARAMTNRVGEFQMEYDARSQPQLRIGIPDQGLFSLTLDQIHTEASEPPTGSSPPAKRG